MTIGGGASVHNHSSGSQGGASLPSHVPPGFIGSFAHDQDPGAQVGDWLECNGQNVSRDTYANLFAKIGVIWGAGDGVSTFTLPDARRRSLVGAGGTGTATLDSVVGSTGGEETHLNTATESGTEAHSHTITSRCTNGGGGAGTQMFLSSFSTNTGGGGAVNTTSTAAVTAANAAASSAASGHNTYHPVYVGGVWIKT